MNDIDPGFEALQTTWDESEARLAEFLGAASDYAEGLVTRSTVDERREAFREACDSIDDAIHHLQVMASTLRTRGQDEGRALIKQGWLRERR